MRNEARGARCGSRCSAMVGAAVLWGASLGVTGCATVEPERTADVEGAPAVSPTLAAEAQASRTLKRRVTIARFSNETDYGKSVLLDPDEGLIAEKASDMLSARLTRSGKFLLFERTDSEALLRALDEGELGSMGLPSELLLIGSLSEFGRRTVGESGVFSRTKKQVAQARVNVRLVDVATSRVIFADEGAGEASNEVGTVLGVGTKAGYDSTLDDQAISAAISKVVGNLMENLLDRPWRSFVLEVDEDLVYIGGGASQGIEPGDRLRLVRRGKKVVNPQTELPVELPGEDVGELEVVSTFGDTPADEGTICRLLSDRVEPSDVANDPRAFVVEETTEGKGSRR